MALAVATGMADEKSIDPRIELTMLRQFRFTKQEWAIFAAHMLNQTEEGLVEMAADKSLSMQRRYLATIILKGFITADHEIFDKILSRIIGRPDIEITQNINSTADNIRLLPTTQLVERVGAIYETLKTKAITKGETSEP